MSRPRFIKVGCYRAGMNLAAVREFESRVGGVKQDLCKRFVGWHEAAPVEACQELIAAGVTPLVTYELWQVDPAEGVLAGISAFPTDSNADGIADGWIRSTGTSTIVSHQPGAQRLKALRTTAGVAQQRWIKGEAWHRAQPNTEVDTEIHMRMLQPSSGFSGQPFFVRSGLEVKSATGVLSYHGQTLTLLEGDAVYEAEYDLPADAAEFRPYLEIVFTSSASVGMEVELELTEFSCTRESNMAYSPPLAEVAAGVHDQHIIDFLSPLAGLGEIWLRTLHEMNGHWYPWCPPVRGNPYADSTWSIANVIAVYNRIGMLARVHAPNLKLMWCPNAEGPEPESGAYDGDPHINEYWPGSQYVDIIGIDGYNMDTATVPYRSFAETFDKAYADAILLGDQPLCIPETATRTNTTDGSLWVRNMFATLRAKYTRVKSVLWFDHTETSGYNIDSTPELQATYADEMQMLDKDVRVEIIEPTRCVGHRRGAYTLAEARDFTDTTNITTDPNLKTWSYNGTNITRVARGMLQFDIPKAGVIKSVSLSIRGQFYVGTGEVTHLVKSTSSHPKDVVMSSVGVFPKALPWGWFDRAIPDVEPNAPLNLAIVGDHDYTNTAPPDNAENWVQFYDTNASEESYRPYLTLVYMVDSEYVVGNNIERAALIDDFDLRRAPYAIAGRDLAPEFPPPTLTPSGIAAQAAGIPPHESHFDDAPWQLTVLVSNPTDASISDLVSRFRPGAVLTWRESIATLQARLVSASLDSVRYVRDRMAAVTLSGTRRAAWEAPERVVLTGEVAGWGVLDVPSPKGEISAPCSLRLMNFRSSGQSWSGLIAAGIKVNPPTGYEPLAIATATADISTAWSEMYPGYVFAYPQMAGRHMIVGMPSLQNASVNWVRARSEDEHNVTSPTRPSSTPMASVFGELGLPELSQAARMPTVMDSSGMKLFVQAKRDSGSQSAASCSRLCLVPTDQGAFVTGLFAIDVVGDHIHYVDGRTHMFTAFGEALRQPVITRPYGTDFAVAPGALNRIVVAGGPTDRLLDYQLTYRPRYLSRF